MKRLSPEAFARARRFLKTEARPVDRARFEYRFERASAEHVLPELARFQNEDGGLGRALEPDLRTPSSSALATGLGLRVLKELECPANHRMVRRAVAYLVATYDASERVWRVAPPDTNAFPHAPWWHDEGGSLAQRFGGFRIIPRALLVGLLWHFSAAVPAGWLNEVTADAVRCIETVEVLGEGGGSDLEYAIGLAQTQGLPQHYQQRLIARMREAIPVVTVRDPGQWGSYCVTPLRVVPSPRSLGADLIADALQAHLDYEIEHQSPAGTWDPTWTWGNSYPEMWEQAKLEWRGHLTLETLTALRAFGRMTAVHEFTAWHTKPAQAG
jgi:hypothetical protein